MRRADLILLGLFIAATIVAALAGHRASRGGDLFEFRASTEMSGPFGARGLALTLERLDVPVERWRRPLFELGDEDVPVDTSLTVVLLELTEWPSAGERRALRRYVERGGELFLGVVTGLEPCFAIEVEPVDSVALQLPDGVGSVARTGLTVELGELSDAGTDSSVLASCRLAPVRADTLLTTIDGRPVSLALEFDGGGRVTVLAETRYLRNEALAESDAGVVALPLLLDPRPGRVAFDEYHHGFGRRTSIWWVTWRWLVSHPSGWVILQVVVALLLALAAAAVRFGPAHSVIQRARRSGIDHLDALAVGLQRAKGGETAVKLIVEGLRRRTSRVASLRRPSDVALARWLDALRLATTTAAARSELERLRSLLRDSKDDEDVLQAAQSVETIWKAIGRR